MEGREGMADRRMMARWEANGGVGREIGGEEKDGGEADPVAGGGVAVISSMCKQGGARGAIFTSHAYRRTRYAGFRTLSIS